VVPRKKEAEGSKREEKNNSGQGHYKPRREGKAYSPHTNSRGEGVEREASCTLKGRSKELTKCYRLRNWRTN